MCIQSQFVYTQTPGKSQSFNTFEKNLNEYKSENSSWRKQLSLSHPVIQTAIHLFPDSYNPHPDPA